MLCDFAFATAYTTCMTNHYRAGTNSRGGAGIIAASFSCPEIYALGVLLPVGVYVPGYLDEFKFKTLTRSFNIHGVL